MKNLVIFILSFFVYSSVFSQDMIEKRHFENHPELGGDVLIKSSSLRVEKDEIFKTFEIKNLETGAYYTLKKVFVLYNFPLEANQSQNQSVFDLLINEYSMLCYV